MDVQVTEKGNLVTDLAKDDFIVFEENARQEISYFGKEREPLLLLLLLDVSGSTKRYVEQMASVAKQALKYLRVVDKVGLMLFGRNTEVRGQFTPNTWEVAGELSNAHREHDLGAGTVINGSILEAVKYVDSKSEPAQRRAVLIITDNFSLNYKSPDEDVIKALLRSDIVLNAIVVGKGHRPEPVPANANPDFSPANVFRIAEETGGEAIKADRADQTFPQMVERIRSRYSLQYAAPEAPSGSFRRLRVELTASARQRYPKAQIRARSGYYVP